MVGSEHAPCPIILPWRLGSGFAMIVLMVSLFEADVVRSERLGSASDSLDVKLEGRRPVVCSKTDYSAQGILPATI